MKTTTFLRLFTILLASAIFMGCSKEQLPINNANESISSASSAKPDPVYTGSITGSLSPTPTFAEIKVYNDDGSFSVGINPFPDGSFRIDNLPEDIYHLFISYIPVKSPADFYSYAKVPNIKVIEGKVTDVGIVILP